MTAAAALDNGLQELALGLSATAREQLLTYLALLQKWNRTYNLTAIRDPVAMVSHHVLDSSLCFQICRPARSSMWVPARDFLGFR